MNKPIIYVLAGANGVGKTTISFNTLPEGVYFINADDIARQLKESLPDSNVQEIANGEAVARMNKEIFAKRSFAIETNLADNETWLFLKNIQIAGYEIYLNFFCTDNVQTCINRVNARVLEGGHYVRPDIVKQRYESGLKLLKHYKDLPEKLLLIDSTTTPTVLMVLEKGNIVKEEQLMPTWITNLFVSDKEVKVEESLEDIKRKYQEQLKKIDEIKNSKK